MTGRPNHVQIATSASTASTKPTRTTTAPRRVTQMPSFPLATKTWRAWASYLLSGCYVLPEKDARHLAVCIMQHGYLRKWQMRWIFDIVARHEPSGCGTWGAPD